ncbi:protein transport protein SEC13 [Plasmodium gonderi]|uniref:Protein transport protein SEC13 n=1 Tax=Plasmodium gonderi TaxID=77519 RepID=A0A1Y1JTD8_PLAGO|nr:protein transport protein SEC13 [Plasmodium gonderi]GAW83683.1 protein transport protein SEC13 [Plasmodium gonderi]
MNELVVFDTNHLKSINDCELDYYSKKLATCSSDNTVKIFDVSLSKEPVCIAEMRDHSSAVWKVCWSHPKYGSLLASCSYDKSIIIYKEVYMNKYDMIYINNDHKSSVNYIEWSPHEYGLHLGCACSDGQMSIISYNLTKGTNEEGYWNKYSVKAHLNGTSCLSWEKTYNNYQSLSNNKHLNEGTSAGSGGGGDQINLFRLASGGYDNQVIIWMFDNNTKEFHKIYQMNDKPHKSAIKDIAWKPNINNSTNIIASCSDEKIVILWVEDASNNQWKNGQIIKVQHKISKISWSPNGTILAVACTDENAYLFREGMDGQWEEICNLADNEKMQAQMEAQMEEKNDFSEKNIDTITNGNVNGAMSSDPMGNHPTNPMDAYNSSYNNNPGMNNENPNVLNASTAYLNYKPFSNNTGNNAIPPPNMNINNSMMMQGNMNALQSNNNNSHPYGQGPPPPMKINTTMNQQSHPNQQNQQNQQSHPNQQNHPNHPNQQNVTPNYLMTPNKKPVAPPGTTNVSHYSMSSNTPVGTASHLPPPPPPVSHEQGTATSYSGLNYAPPHVSNQQGVTAPQFPPTTPPTNMPGGGSYMSNKQSMHVPPPGPAQQQQQQPASFSHVSTNPMNFGKPTSTIPPSQFQGINTNKTNFSTQQISPPPPPPPPPFGSTSLQHGSNIVKGMNKTNAFSNCNSNMMAQPDSTPPMTTNQPPIPPMKNINSPSNYAQMTYNHPPPPPPNMMGGNDLNANQTNNMQYGAYPNYSHPQ